MTDKPDYTQNGPEVKSGVNNVINLSDAQPERRRGDIDFPTLIEQVARRLLGEPNPSLSTKDELRFGTKGSLSINLKKGVWKSFETDEGGGCLDLIRRETGGDPYKWLRDQHLIRDKTIVATFDYPDEQKTVLYQTYRQATGDIKVRRPDGRGGWIYNIDGVRRVLYRLPELLNSTGIVYITEGEKHADRLRALGLNATCNVFGAGPARSKKWRPEYNEFFRDRDVVVLPDNDDVGREHATKIARNLIRVAKRVRVLALPGLKPKGDILNWLAAGGTVEELVRLTEECPVWEETGPGTPEDGGNYERDTYEEDGRPIIKVVGGEIARIVDQTEQALIAAQVPVMVRAGALVQPIIDTRPAADGSQTEVTILSRLNSASLGYHVNKSAATFIKYNERKKGWHPTDPPATVTATLLSKGEWRLSKVIGVVTAPTMRPDGSILTEPGYDNVTQLWHAPAGNLRLPPIEDSRAAAEAALELLKNLLQEFPFKDDLDRAVALAGLMTPVLRGACDVVPLIVILAHTAGSGKSFLADLANIIVRGQKCPVITAPESAEELEKRLGAIVLEGAQIISLDNCSHDLGGDLLCQITERPLIRIRILGKSEAPECEWRGTVFANGNNISLLEDMTRRAVICNLDPQMERPELRTFRFDPIQSIMDARGKYVAAILTIARAYRASGASVTADPIASYGLWSRAVREPLIWLGECDPVKSMDQARKQDPARAQARELIEYWAQHLSTSNTYSAREIIARANAGDLVEDKWVYHYPDFRDLLLTRCGIRESIDPTTLGKWLVKIHGQVHDRHRVDIVKQSGKHGNRFQLIALNANAQQQAVLPLDQGGDGGDGG